jgi:hypothetical protein
MCYTLDGKTRWAGDMDVRRSQWVSDHRSQWISNREFFFGPGRWPGSSIRADSEHFPDCNRGYPESPGYTTKGQKEGGDFLVFDWIVVRGAFLLVLSLASYYLEPFGLEKQLAGLTGLGLGVAILLFEYRLSQASLKRLIGAAVGSILGIIGAYLMSLVLGQSVFPRNTLSFLQILVMLWMTYIGLVVGAAKGDMLNLAALGGLFGSEKQNKRPYKILDTSVIIDGRIADICATGFLEDPENGVAQRTDRR